MPTRCEIRFDNEPERVYYGGQLLSGRVTLSLTKEKTVRGTSLRQPEIHKQKKKKKQTSKCTMSKCAYHLNAYVRATRILHFFIGAGVVVVRERLCMHDRFDAAGHPPIGCYCDKIILSDRKVLIENFATDFLCGCFVLFFFYLSPLILFFHWTARLGR